MRNALARWQDRRAARRWNAQQEAAHRAWIASGRYAEIKACAHASRRFNAKATAVIAAGNTPEICNDCGTGIVKIGRGA